MPRPDRDWPCRVGVGSRALPYLRVRRGGDGSSLGGPEGLVGWIGQTRAAVPDLTFQIQVAPSSRAATSLCGGARKAATPAVGTPVAFTGTDLLRVHDGQLVEYWVNSDIHLLLMQLRVKAG